MTKGKIIIMSSGEIAPWMVNNHKKCVKDIPVNNAIILNTPYFFQQNVDYLDNKYKEYFKKSIGLKTDIFNLCESQYEIELFKNSLCRSQYLFSGPGSPSFAYKKWSQIDMKNILEEFLNQNGVICFASAASLTLGAYTLPVYEIYKAGEEPFWLPGLNLLEKFGINCIVLPHFNNNEGGEKYDSSYCYIGKNRFFNKMLPLLNSPTIGILGLEEGTVISLEIETKRYRVLGKGNAYWIINNHQYLLEEEGDFSVFSSFSSLSYSHIDVEDDKDEKKEKKSKLIQEYEKLQFVFNNLVVDMIEFRKKLRKNKYYNLSDEMRHVLLKNGVSLIDTGEHTKHFLL